MYLSNTLYIPYWQYCVLLVCRCPVYGSWSCTAPLRNATEQQSTSELSSFTMNCSSLIRYPDTFKDLKTRLDTSDNYIITISFPGWHHFIPRLTPSHSQADTTSFPGWYHFIPILIPIVTTLAIQIKIWKPLQHLIPILYLDCTDLGVRLVGSGNRHTKVDIFFLLVLFGHLPCLDPSNTWSEVGVPPATCTQRT